MTCPRCRLAMVAQKHLCHNQRKWRCPQCGRLRFERLAHRRHRPQDTARGRRRGED